MQEKLRKNTRRFFISIWAFPAILFLLLIVASSIKLHGSSVGMFHVYFYGEKSEDSSLLFGVPRNIRSDEWRGAWTPYTLSQSQNDYKEFNDRLGSGRDMIFSPDSPTTDWPTLFRPHNWAFLALPFEFAFAFRWWLGLYLIVTAMYFLILRIFNKDRKMFAILMSLSLGLSPFLFWWHRPSLHLSVAYSLLLIILGIRLINREGLFRAKNFMISQAVYVALMIFLVVALALLIYAPFIIVCFLVTIFFLLGYALQKLLSEKKFPTGELKRLLVCAAIIGVVGGGILGAIISQHWDVVEAVGNSEYPGQRLVEAGRPPFPAVNQLFGGFLQPLLQSSKYAANYFSNQSESSNFILLLPLFLLPGIYLQIRYWRKKHKIDYVFLLINILALIYIAFMTIPFGDLFYKLLLLDRVPQNRLVLGIGLVGFIQLLYFIKLREEYDAKSQKKLISPQLLAAYSALVFIVLAIFGAYIMKTYPGFVPNKYVGALLGIFFWAIVVSFLYGKKMLGASLMLIFSLCSSTAINPVYRGLEIVRGERIFNKIREVSSENDTWIVVDALQYENIPMMSGRHQIGGQQLYADLELWSQADTDGDDMKIYNRQAHALFLSNTLPPNPDNPYNIRTIDDDIELVKQNMFKIKFTCSDFFFKNVDYILTFHELGNECLEYIDKVTYPSVEFTIYKINPTI